MKHQERTSSQHHQDRQAMNHQTQGTPTSGGYPLPDQQYQQRFQTSQHPQSQHGPTQSYPRPQSWQQPSYPNPNQIPQSFQTGSNQTSNEQSDSYPIPQGMVVAAPPPHYPQHPHRSSNSEPSQISPSESDFAGSSSEIQESMNYSSQAVQYQPQTGYYLQHTYPQAQQGGVPFAARPGFAFYGVPGQPQSWSPQPQFPMQQTGPQSQGLSQIQQHQMQQQQMRQHQQPWVGGVSTPPPTHHQFGSYGYPPGFISPSSSRHSSGRMDHLRASNGSSNGSRASPGGNHPRQNSVAASLASSESSAGFSPYGTTQSPRPSDTTSPEQAGSISASESQAEVKPAPRSDWVLWAGNVPNVSIDELWSFFSTIPVEESGLPSQPVGTSEEEREATQDQHGILSIHLISRSNCCFINYISEDHLNRALGYFHGKIILPDNPRCQRLVVRIRKKGDEQMSGVAGQRGKGMHVAWVKEQERKKKEAVIIRGEETLPATPGKQKPQQTKPESPSEHSTTGSTSTGSGQAKAGTRPSPTHDSSSGSIGSVNSFTSTNSSLLRHPAFRTRYFILKSKNVEDLDRSVQDGAWRTQTHNEPVLDQAFRNSENVILVFSANSSGNFYGYAKMKGLILPTLKSDENLPSTTSKSTAISSTPRTETIAENNEDEESQNQKRGSTLKPDGTHQVVLSPDGGIGPSTTSPLALSPGNEATANSTYFPPQSKEAAASSWPPVSTSTETEEARRASLSPTLLFAPRAPDLVSRLSGTSISSEAKVTSEKPENNIMNSTWPARSQIKEQDGSCKRNSIGAVEGGFRDSPASLTGGTSTPQLSVNSPQPHLSSMPLSPIGLPSHSAPTSLGPTGSTDQFGVTRRDTIPSANGVSNSFNADLSNFIGPTDSVSWPDSRAFSELAIRAVIHNLRLEERESLKEAREASEQSNHLESSLANSDGQIDSKATIAAQVAKAAATSGPDQMGTPFQIEWKETRPLPFAAVRHLRNPWRDGKQIKVSRDGTELEPTVGNALMEEWAKAVQNS